MAKCTSVDVAAVAVIGLIVVVIVSARSLVIVKCTSVDVTVVVVIGRIVEMIVSIRCPAIAKCTSAGGVMKIVTKKCTYIPAALAFSAVLGIRGFYHNIT